MSDDPDEARPLWWRVDRRAAREAARQARREERAERKEARHGRGAGHEPITPDRIADAALRLIDAHGTEGLTVRALAQELGVGTMTLYWYVQNKDEVLDLIGDRVLAEVPAPSMELDWRDSVRQGAADVRAAFLRHARAVSIVIERGAIGPSSLRLLESTLAVLRAAGFGDRDAVDAYVTLSNFVTGSCSYETSPQGRAGRSDPGRTPGETMRQYVAALPPGSYPNVIATAQYMFTPDRDSRFAFGVECLIAGFEARLRAQKAAGS
jgi:TetR/AcrR family tetracycline transcriptional repressor